MRRAVATVVVSLTLSPMWVACGGSDPDFPNVQCDDLSAANCIQVASGDSQGLFEAVNSLEADTTVLLGIGTYDLDNQVTIRADRVNLVGQGMMETTLAFSSATTQINGVDVVGDDFLVQDLTVLDAPKDGIRVEDSDGVTYRRIRTTWTEAESSDNGAYGIYPVRCSNVLVEDSVAENASDAGLYVGQCINVIVRNNTATGNVAGIEIENTQYADVYGNVADSNTGGLLVFDLPGNPVVGRDVRIRDNIVTNNNTENFAPGGTVGIIPAGSGMIVLASRRVEIVNNTLENNGTLDIAVTSGLVVDGDVERWTLDESELVGDWDDLGLLPGSSEGTVTNFRTENIVVAGNSHSGSGDDPDIDKELGQLVAVLFPGFTAASVIYGGIGESQFHATDATMNSNDNYICAGGNVMGTGFANVNLGVQVNDPGQPILMLEDAPFAPYDCTELRGGPVAEVVLQ